MPRSQKKAFKPRVVKKDNMDEQTKDEKEYLGGELFTILQEVKKEFDTDEVEHHSDGPDEKKSTGMLGVSKSNVPNRNRVSKAIDVKDLKDLEGRRVIKALDVKDLKGSDNKRATKVIDAKSLKDLEGSFKKKKD